MSKPEQAPQEQPTPPKPEAAPGTVENYYDVLGIVDKSASGKEIRKAYLGTIAKYRDDTEMSQEERQKKIDEVEKARTALFNKSSRAEYDDKLEKYLSHQAEPKPEELAQAPPAPEAPTEPEKKPEGPLTVLRKGREMRDNAPTEEEKARIEEETKKAMVEAGKKEEAPVPLAPEAKKDGGEADETPKKPEAVDVLPADEPEPIDVLPAEEPMEALPAEPEPEKKPEPPQESKTETERKAGAPLKRESFEVGKVSRETLLAEAIERRKQKEKEEAIEMCWDRLSDEEKEQYRQGDVFGMEAFERDLGQKQLQQEHEEPKLPGDVFYFAIREGYALDQMRDMNLWKKWKSGQPLFERVVEIPVDTGADQYEMRDYAEKEHNQLRALLMKDAREEEEKLNAHTTAEVDEKLKVWRQEKRANGGGSEGAAGVEKPKGKPKAEKTDAKLEALLEAEEKEILGGEIQEAKTFEDLLKVIDVGEGEFIKISDYGGSKENAKYFVNLLQEALAELERGEEDVETISRNINSNIIGRDLFRYFYKKRNSTEVCKPFEDRLVDIATERINSHLASEKGGAEKAEPEKREGQQEKRETRVKPHNVLGEIKARLDFTGDVSINKLAQSLLYLKDLKGIAFGVDAIFEAIPLLVGVDEQSDMEKKLKKIATYDKVITRLIKEGKQMNCPGCKWKFLPSKAEHDEFTQVICPSCKKHI